MNLVSIRIITADIKRLTRFYEQLTGIAVTMYTEDFGELKTSSCTLAIGSTRTLQLFGGDVARPADNHTAILEFRVGDVDAEYRKLADMIGDSVVQKPATMPWGKSLAPVPRSPTAIWSTSSRRSARRRSIGSTSDSATRRGRYHGRNRSGGQSRERFLDPSVAVLPRKNILIFRIHS